MGELWLYKDINSLTNQIPANFKLEAITSIHAHKLFHIHYSKLLNRGREMRLLK